MIALCTVDSRSRKSQSRRSVLEPSGPLSCFAALSIWPAGGEYISLGTDFSFATQMLRLRLSMTLAMTAFGY